MIGVLSRLTEALPDSYRVTRELGRGGMATVFLGEDSRDPDLRRRHCCPGKPGTGPVHLRLHPALAAATRG